MLKKRVVVFAGHSVANPAGLTVAVVFATLGMREGEKSSMYLHMHRIARCFRESRTLHSNVKPLIRR